MRARGLVHILGAAGLAISAHTIQGQHACTSNPIACENQLTGNPSSEWDITGAGDLTLQGFATEISVNDGDIVISKSTRQQQHFKSTSTAWVTTVEWARGKWPRSPISRAATRRIASRIARQDS
jgi:hypothetical protein